MFDHNTIKEIFADKVITDDRVPLLTILMGENKWGFFLPDVKIWLQVLIILVLQSAFSCLIGSIVYKFIIPRREWMSARIIGFLLIGFLCISYPYHVIRYLDIKNTALRFSICMLGTLASFFRSIEALNNFSPPAVEESLSNYILYFSSFLEVKFDPKTKRVVRASTSDALHTAQAFVKSLFIAGAVLSLLRQEIRPYFEPFHSTFDANTSSRLGLFTGIFDLNLFRNNIATAIIYQVMLTAYTHSLCALMIGLFRVQVQCAFYNPLFESTTPSEFWAKRWNVMVHAYLKRGVFKPVMKVSSSKVLASFSAFIASGLVHEWLLLNLYFDCELFQPRMGINTLFFLWNAMIIMAEYLLGDAWIFKKLKSMLPRPILTMLVISTAMPVAHWFTHPYSKSDFLVHGETVFPMIKRL